MEGINAQGPAPAASISPVPQTVDTGTGAPLAGQQQAAQTTGVSDDTPITAMVGGQAVTKPLKEWKSGWMMHADYTRKTQEVSTERQALQQREAQVREFLQDPTQVRAYLQMLEGQQQQQVAQNDPNAPVTLQQLAQLARMQEQRTQEMVFAARQQMQVEATAGQIKTAAEAAIAHAINAAPGLRQIPKVDILLRQIAADAQPATIEAMQQAILAAAQTVAGTLNQSVQQQTQQAAAQVARLASHGTEPPGGGNVMPGRTDYSKGSRGTDWKKVGVDAKAWINARIAEGK